MPAERILRRAARHAPRAVPFDRRPALRAAEGLRQRDRRDAEHRSLDRAGDRPGIGDVLRDVLAPVDPRQDEVRATVGHDLPHAHDHAVGRRALHRVMARADLAQPQRIAERQRMGDPRLVGLGGDDEQVVGELAGDRSSTPGPAHEAVVIGDQDLHRQPFRPL